MHQRPPADPLNKDDLLVTASTTIATAMATTTQPVDGLVADMDGDDAYHGITEEEMSDDSREDCEGTARHEADLFDDVFGGDGGEASLPSTLNLNTTAAVHPSDAHPSDMNRLQQEHSTAGYREGLAAGKNASLQTGFDEGYSLGAALGLVVGELLGLVEGLLGFPVEGENPGAEEGALLARARRELSMQALYAAEYFAPDGTWVYDVGGDDDVEVDEVDETDENDKTKTNNDDDVDEKDKIDDNKNDKNESDNNDTKTIFDVARAHPLVRSWRRKVDTELARRGVRWAKPGEEAELAAVLGLAEDEPDKEPKKVSISAASASPSEPARAPATALDW